MKVRKRLVIVTALVCLSFASQTGCGSDPGTGSSSSSTGDGAAMDSAQADSVGGVDGVSVDAVDGEGGADSAGADATADTAAGDGAPSDATEPNDTADGPTCTGVACPTKPAGCQGSDTLVTYGAGTCELVPGANGGAATPTCVYPEVVVDCNSWADVNQPSTGSCEGAVGTSYAKVGVCSKPATGDAFCDFQATKVDCTQQGLPCGAGVCWPKATGMAPGKAFAADNNMNCVLRAGLEPWCWGFDAGGVVFGSGKPALVKAQALSVTGVVDVAIHSQAICVHTDKGKLHCAGNLLGPGANGNQAFAEVPIAIGETSISKLFSTHTGIGVLTADGQLWSLGQGLGMGPNNETSPIKLASGVSKVIGGLNALIVFFQDGTIQTAGNFGWDVPQYATLTAMTGLVPAGGTTGWDHTVLIDGAGKVWGIGRNEGKLPGTAATSKEWVELLGVEDATAAATSSSSACVVRASKQVECVGSKYGVLGVEPLAPEATLHQPFAPVLVAKGEPLTDVTAIWSNMSAYFVLRGDGTIWWWGGGSHPSGYNSSSSLATRIYPPL